MSKLRHSTGCHMKPLSAEFLLVPACSLAAAAGSPMVRWCSGLPLCRDPAKVAAADIRPLVTQPAQYPPLGLGQYPPPQVTLVTHNGAAPPLSSFRWHDVMAGVDIVQCPRRIVSKCIKFQVASTKNTNQPLHSILSS